MLNKVITISASSTITKNIRFENSIGNTKIAQDYKYGANERNRRAPLTVFLVSTPVIGNLSHITCKDN